MAKTKVFELAKELGIHSKDVITFLQGKGWRRKPPKAPLKTMRQRW
ncbi:MAG: translation initiation factor IF-2 N-terminal domain-containing protein [Eisenbergiella massiliensis]